MSEEKPKDWVDKLFDTIDKGVDKYVGRMSQISTPDKEEKEDHFQREQRSAEVPPPNRPLLANPDIVIVEPDDVHTIIKAMKEAVGVWKQRGSSNIPERSRTIANANAIAAESIVEEIEAKLAQGFHLILKR